ncbi:MAG: PRC-barrel domain-containing protein [Caldilineaceae bacterium]
MATIQQSTLVRTVSFGVVTAALVVLSACTPTPMGPAATATSSANVAEATATAAVSDADATATASAVDAVATVTVEDGATATTIAAITDADATATAAAAVTEADATATVEGDATATAAAATNDAIATATMAADVTATEEMSASVGAASMAATPVSTTTDITNTMAARTNLVRASALIGYDVRNRQDEDLGTVHDLIVGRSNEDLAYAGVNCRWLSGIGERYHLTVLVYLHPDTANSHLVLNVDNQVLKDAPNYSANELPNIADPNWGCRCCTYRKQTFTVYAHNTMTDTVTMTATTRRRLPVCSA